MSYRPSHAKPGSLARLASRGGVIASAAALAAATAGAIAVPAANATATPLQVSFGTQVQGDGSSAGFNSAGAPVLTLGTGTSTTGAYVTIDGVNGTAVPSSEPTFTTDNYAAGSPRWYITLSNGHSLWGYPPNAKLNGSDFGWAVDNGNTYMSWANALTAAGAGSSTTVTAAQIIADGDQAAGTPDTLTGVQYGGQTIGGGTVTLGTEANQQATEGTAFTLEDQATTTSSDPALAYTATGLPSGLSIDPSTGTISGIPGETGQFAVTVHAKDAYGDGSNWQHFVLDVNPAVTYTASLNGGEGVIKNAFSGKYLNVAASAGGVYATGDKLIQWGSGGISHEKFEIVTLTGSDGTRGGYLEAIAPNGTKWFVVTHGSGQLTLGGPAPAYLTDASAEASTIVKSSEDMVKNGPYYTFLNDLDSTHGAMVMDDDGWSQRNGGWVIAYTQLGTTNKNQQWSLP